MEEIRHAKWAHKFNDIREEGDALYIRVKDKEVIIDKEDIEKILPYRVVIAQNGYAYSYKRLISRLVMDCPKGYEVDHINHDVLDNRKINLRIADRSINGMNKKPQSNTGEYGITKRKDGWYMVTVADQYRGIRKTLKDAVLLRDECLKGTKQSKLNFFLSGKVALND